MHAEQLIRKSHETEFFIRMTLGVQQSMITANMLVNKFATRYNYIRNLKNLELGKYVQDFKASPISLVCSFDDPND